MAQQDFGPAETAFGDRGRGSNFGWGTLAVSILIVGATHAILLLTKSVQEDAFITFRTAFNLADHGQLTFNLGHQYNAATSLLYPLWIALWRLGLGSLTIPFILLLNSVAVVTASALMARVISHYIAIGPKRTLLLFVVIAISPVSLLMASRGMEAALIVLAMALGIDSLNRGRKLPLAVCIAVLPLLRPDALLFSGLFVICTVFAKGRMLFASAIGAVTGLALYFLLSPPIYGGLLPRTVTAKSTAYQNDSLSLFQGLTDLAQSYAFAPVHSKYIVASYGWFTVIAVVLSTAIALSTAKFHRERLAVVALVLGAIWIPVSIYFIRGIVFPWYLWPSGFLYASCVWAVIFFTRKRFLTHYRVWPEILILGAALIVAATQAALSFQQGLQEAGYRASIGTYLSSKAQKHESLFLEPAGYIPFYSGLQTIDAVGLASPLATEYIIEGDGNWTEKLIREQRPSWLVLRTPVKNLQSENVDPLLPPLDRVYCLQKKFTYDPADFSPQVLLPIARLGSHSPYFVYRLGRCHT